MLQEAVSMSSPHDIVCTSLDLVKLEVSITTVNLVLYTVLRKSSQWHKVVTMAQSACLKAHWAQEVTMAQSARLKAHWTQQVTIAQRACLKVHWAQEVTMAQSARHKAHRTHGVTMAQSALLKAHRAQLFTTAQEPLTSPTGHKRENGTKCPFQGPLGTICTGFTYQLRIFW